MYDLHIYFLFCTPSVCCLSLATVLGEIELINRSAGGIIFSCG